MPLASETRAAIADAAWAVAERLGTFTYAEVGAQAHISKDVAVPLVRQWVADKRCELVEEGGKGKGAAHVFRVLVRRVRPGRPGSALQNLWNAMRGLRSFTPTDLAAHACTDLLEVSKDTARAYCQTLLRAGYLKVERTAIPGRREAIYRLIRNSGPRPPQERRVRAVFDENVGKVVHVEGGEL